MGSDSLDLELQGIGNYPMCMLGPELWSPGAAANTVDR